jgi:formate-dependent nitrite reductase membrane component NrfD
VAAHAWQYRLALAGLPLGLAVAIYTAVLLGVIVARPLWNTPILAILFVLSALSTAAALVMLLVAGHERRLLVGLDLALIAAEGVTVVSLLVYGLTSGLAMRRAVLLLMSGDLAVSFWFGVVLLGLVVPFVLELRRRRSRLVSELAAALLVLMGGFLLRYVIVISGQQSSF